MLIQQEQLHKYSIVYYQNNVNNIIRNGVRNHEIIIFRCYDEKRNYSRHSQLDCKPNMTEITGFPPAFSDREYLLLIQNSLRNKDTEAIKCLGISAADFSVEDAKKYRWIFL